MGSSGLMRYELMEVEKWQGSRGAAYGYVTASGRVSPTLIGFPRPS
jgi:hypothetical protein